ncbi:glycosyltransferase family 4 protein [Lysobacter enzymogenes]|uniref:glycosyltransferase family 4 protein n=1 Tax=Lysobacter enzymogenes TaxID=69 RepID=UPI00099C0047|nr:glycosyltransferase family 4 protein [Lysobacter enzymogenes]UZW58520.1 glycosyltransferase family 4 protein [Lysobacter enzymogenes]
MTRASVTSAHRGWELLPPQPRRALHLINGEHYAGAERVQDLLAQQLPRFGWDVDFACLKPGAFERERSARDSRIITVPMRSRLDLAPARRVAELLERGGYDLLHTHTVRSLLVGRFAARRARRPLLHHVHSRTDRDTESALRNRVNSAIQRFGAARAARLVAVSHGTAHYLRGLGYDDEVVRVVPNGVPVNPAPRPWIAPDGAWTLGMVALFRPRKGVEVLIDALAQLRAQGRDVGLRAVGGFESDAYREQVLAHAQARGVAEQIHWTGFTRDVSAELARIDLFVLPSLYGEGLPMVLIEALSLGLPVVATANEGVPEVLADGRAGELVPPGDATALAAAIAALMDDPARAAVLAGRGLQRQRERYSDVAMARQVAAVYEEVLQEAQR